MSTRINAQQLSKTAFLARLRKHADEQFIAQFGDDLNSILAYADQINEVNVDGVDPLTAFRTITISELREDTEPHDSDAYQRQRVNIINNFPNKQQNLLVIQGIFDNS